MPVESFIGLHSLSFPLTFTVMPSITGLRVVPPEENQKNLEGWPQVEVFEGNVSRSRNALRDYSDQIPLNLCSIVPPYWLRCSNSQLTSSYTWCIYGLGM